MARCRVVPGLGQRAAAAAQLGFRHVFARFDQSRDADGVSAGFKGPRMAGLEVIAVRNIGDAITAVFGAGIVNSGRGHGRRDAAVEDSRPSGLD